MDVFETWDHWTESPLGSWLLQQEQFWMDQSLEDVFGYNAIQIGPSKLDCLRSNRIQCKVRLCFSSEALPKLSDANTLLVSQEFLPFQPQTVDLFVLSHVLELVKNPHQLLREVERILIPEGKLIICGFNPVSLWSVKRKLNAIASEFRNKNVLLVDDSIVRGTTSKQIIDLAREAGAKKVYMASAAPPVKYPNVYGIDMPASHEFAADGRTELEISKLIGADRLFYQDLDDLISAVKDQKSPVKKFDSSCFDGNYVTGNVTDSYLKELDDLRNDVAKNKNNQDDHDDVMVY